MVEKADAFQRRAPLIHVCNGVLHLDEDPPGLHPFSPDYYSRNRSEIQYDPAGTCPRFLDELLRPALPEEDISLLQRYAGMCLLGGNPAHRLLVLRGTAGGGKSTLVEIIETVNRPGPAGACAVLITSPQRGRPPRHRRLRHHSHDPPLPTTGTIFVVASVRKSRHFI